MAYLRLGVQQQETGLWHPVALIWDGDTAEGRPHSAMRWPEGFPTAEEAAQYAASVLVPALPQGEPVPLGCSD